jgi:fibro-slime domain-containing protein
MRLLNSMSFIALPSALALFVGACASGTIVNSGAGGSGGSNGDANFFLYFDANTNFLKFDGRVTNRVGSDAPPGPNCGNGELTKDEACDDGNTVSGDGCANNCLSVEPGFSCVNPGKPCRPVARCGDGLVVFPEQCDDSNKTNGDGCSDGCRIEIGWKCDGNPSLCSRTTCGDGKIEGAEGCDDGNAMPFDGCSSDCQNEPICKGTSACTSRCGDGIVLGEDCDDGNNIDGDGCASSCKIEQGFKCGQPALGDKMMVPVIYRDFRFHKPADFESGTSGSYAPFPGMVNASLDANGKPVYSGIGGSAHVASADSFSQWYKDVSGINHTTTSKMTLWNDGKGNYVNRYGANGEQWNTTTPANWCGTVADAMLDASGTPIPCTFKYQKSDANPTGSETDCLKLEAQGYTQLPGSCKADSGGTYKAQYIVSKADGNPLFFPVDDDSFTPADERKPAKIAPYYDASASWPFDTDAAGNNRLHNFSFTSEVRYWFLYDKAKTYTLDFVGDDDVWVFINRKLAVDLGGVHTPIDGNIVIGTDGNGKTTITQTYPIPVPASIQQSAPLGLQNGQVYEIAVFQAERQTDGSSYKLTLSGFNAAPSICKPVCGDGILAIGEECDDGPLNGSGAYGTCSTNCTLDAGFCGDGVVQAGEECDDGGLNGTAPDKCPSGCHFLVPIL